MIKKTDLTRWLEKIAETYQLIGPTLDGIIQFRPLGSIGELVLDYANSVIPPKNLFLPQTECIFAFRWEEDSIVLEPVGGLERERVLFGIRPCDAYSLLLLDKVLTADPGDTYYQEKRRRTILIGLACPSPPQGTCFCAAFGIDPLSSEGVDILLTDLGDRYTVAVATEAGEQVVALSRDFFSRSPRDRKPKGERESEVSVEGIVEKIVCLSGDGYWEELGRRCLGCGVCTYLCPTCHCFDFTDVGSRLNGRRFRCWDSCMFADFTRMGSGANPRPTGNERIRQRYFDKFCYFPEKYESLGCVGCGRCSQHCPVGIDIRTVIREIMVRGAK